MKTKLLAVAVALLLCITGIVGYWYIREKRAETNIQEMLSGLKEKSRPIENTTTNSLFPDLP